MSIYYERGKDSGASVDEKAVQALIVERTNLRRLGDYEGADALRNELLTDFGVTLWDRDRMWMHGTTEPPAKKERKPRENEGFRIFVENLSFETEWQQLKDHFAAAGYPVVYASVSYDREQRRSKGCGLVQFDTADAMEHALSEEGMTGSILDGRAINCRPDYKSPLFDESGRRGDGLRGGRSVGWEEQKFQDQRGNRRRTVNEHGHDYERHPDDSAPLEEGVLETINRLLWQRLEAKFSRDFALADQLKEARWRPPKRLEAQA